MQALYTAHATATGGRDGRAVSDNQALDVALSTPRELGGAGGTGTNPEQLFAAGYAACFLSALKLVASQTKTAIPAATTISAAVGVGPNGNGGFSISASLAIHIPGMDQATAEALVEKTHHVCPYSNATRGNVDVQLNVNVG